MMRGKCDGHFCNKKATGEYLIQVPPSNKKVKHGTAWTMKYCDDCKPKALNNNITLIYGK